MVILNTYQCRRFFKSIIHQQQLNNIQQQYPDIVAYPYQHASLDVRANHKVAGWLLDTAGWRGKAYKGFMMYKQAFVLTNPQRQSAQALLAFGCITTIHR